MTFFYAITPSSQNEQFQDIYQRTEPIFAALRNYFQYSNRMDGNFAYKMKEDTTNLGYMHNGLHNTLEEVMEFYEEITVGEEDHLTINVSENQLDEEMQDLDLDDDQIDEIIVFLNALNDLDFDIPAPDVVPSDLSVGGNID